jgi:hypothetical protein
VWEERALQKGEGCPKGRGPVIAVIEAMEKEKTNINGGKVGRRAREGMPWRQIEVRNRIMKRRSCKEVGNVSLYDKLVSELEIGNLVLIIIGVLNAYRKSVIMSTSMSIHLAGMGLDHGVVS